MNLTSPAASLSDRFVVDSRCVIFVGALGLAIATQAALAVTFGAAPASARDTWFVALMLGLALILPAAGLLVATWRLRDASLGWPLAAVIVIAGVLMRVPYFGAGPMLEDDHFRYLLDGAMVAQGLSPYTHSPEALLRRTGDAPEALISAGHPFIAAINFPELRSIYPGGAQLLFALAHLVAPWSLDGLRVVIFGAEAFSALLVWRVLVSTGQPPQLVALYWCNPLMAFCLTGQAHIDAVLALPILAALIAAHRHAGVLAGLGLGFAAGVKLWPVLLAPLIMRALWPNRRALAGFALALGAALLVLCGPLLRASLSANAGLTAYAGGWSVNNAPYAWLSHLFFHLLGAGTGERLLRVLVMIAAAGAGLIVARRRPEGMQALIERAAALAAILFYLSPAQFPWYAAWFLPLAAAGGSWPLAAAALGLPVYYLFFPLALAGLRDIHSYGLAFLHLVPVVVVALLLRRSAAAGSRS